LLVVIAVALAAVVILLALQNRNLKTQIASLSARLPATESLEPGDVFGPLVLIDETGARVPLVFDAGPRQTLLLLFTLTCPACEKTLPVWSELVAGVTNPELRVVGVQLDRANDPGSLATVTLPFQVYGVEPAESTALAKMPYIPSTVILDGNGVVEQAWFGMLTEAQRQEVRSFLGGG
jgi:peroxiredoxin